MFSKIENFFKAGERKTEAIDTRMAVRRKEDRDEARRENREKAESAPELWEDRLEVTVPALIAFLKGLIPEEDIDVETSVAADKEGSSPPAQSAPPQRKPVNPQREKAAAAYQHAQESTGAAATGPPGERSARTLPAGVTLDEEDMREIHRLLDDLQTLSQRGVQNLSIERSDSLLYSLRQAVNKKL